MENAPNVFTVVAEGAENGPHDVRQKIANAENENNNNQDWVGPQGQQSMDPIWFIYPI